MAGRDIQIPFGPDKTGGMGYAELGISDPEPVEQDPFAEPPLPQAQPVVDPFAPQPQAQPVPDPFADPSRPAVELEPMPAPTAEAAPETAPESVPEPAPEPAAAPETAIQPQAETEAETETVEEYHAGGYTRQQATENGMDDMQMSILAFKDSIGQSRELKARQKEREELAEALRADHEELADRENILANYQQLVAEQDAIIAERTQQRDTYKAELAQITADADALQAQLDQVREQYAVQLAPLETEMGQVKADSDRAKNDERSRKSELNAALSELRRANDADANTMAVARHQKTEAAYNEAKLRAEACKEHLAQVQKAYDDMKAQAKQAIEPLELNLEDLNKQAAALKDSIARLGEDISAARKRRQYCDTVYQYPDETAKMRREVEEAEVTAKRMDAENRRLSSQLAQSKQKAKKAKIALAIVILVIIVFIITWIVVGAR